MVEERLVERAKELLPRTIESSLVPFLKGKEIIALVGSRQVGKTSLMFRIINYLLEKEGTPPYQILYCLPISNSGGFSVPSPPVEGIVRAVSL